MQIKRLVWTNENREHITEHNVIPEEVKELFFEDQPHFRRGPGEQLYHVYGQTAPGRYLFVVMIYLGDNEALVVTARDMTKNERQLYKREVKK